MPPFDIYMSVHRNVIPNYGQQDATFLDLFISTDAVHVSGGSSAHHQEHRFYPEILCTNLLAILFNFIITVDNT